jgi:predicted nucleic acid-binding protein
VSHFTALYDACTLYPATTRDLLMWLATTGMFRAKWTAQIHDEWISSLLRKRPNLGREDLNQVRLLMDAAVPDCIVEGYEALIGALALPDPDDRHVLAAAIQGRANVIVTYNLSDFPADTLATYGLEAQHPDEFVSHLIDLNDHVVLTAVRKMRANLRAPPVSAEDLIARLEAREFIETAAFLRRALGSF